MLWSYVKPILNRTWPRQRSEILKNIKNDQWPLRQLQQIKKNNNKIESKNKQISETHE